MPGKRRNQRTIKAYREAGHAVVAYILGVKVRRVSIAADPGVMIEQLGTDERAICVGLAGPYAQRRFAPQSEWRCKAPRNQPDDLANVAELITRMHGRGDVARKYRAYVRARAERLLEENWLQLETVARGLLERHAITGDEMAELMFGRFKP